MVINECEITKNMYVNSVIERICKCSMNHTMTNAVGDMSCGFSFKENQFGKFFSVYTNVITEIKPNGVINESEYKQAEIQIVGDLYKDEYEEEKANMERLVTDIEFYCNMSQIELDDQEG